MNLMDDFTMKEKESDNNYLFVYMKGDTFKRDVSLRVNPKNYDQLCHLIKLAYASGNQIVEIYKVHEDSSHHLVCTNNINIDLSQYTEDNPIEETSLAYILHDEVIKVLPFKIFMRDNNPVAQIEVPWGVSVRGNGYNYLARQVVREWIREYFPAIEHNYDYFVIEFVTRSDIRFKFGPDIELPELTELGVTENPNSKEEV